jgi:hypothetical protein
LESLLGESEATLSFNALVLPAKEAEGYHENRSLANQIPQGSILGEKSLRLAKPRKEDL